MGVASTLVIGMRERIVEERVMGVERGTYDACVRGFKGAFEVWPLLGDGSSSSGSACGRHRAYLPIRAVC